MTRAHGLHISTEVVRVAVLTTPNATLAGTSFAFVARDLQCRIARPLVAARLAHHDEGPGPAVPFLSSFREPDLDRPFAAVSFAETSAGGRFGPGGARARVARERQRRTLAPSGLEVAVLSPALAFVCPLLPSSLAYGRFPRPTSSGRAAVGATESGSFSKSARPSDQVR
jgi:hypothetical protein